MTDATGPPGRALLELAALVGTVWSVGGLTVWVRYALVTLKPWRGLTAVYAAHLESPGTKAYSVGEAGQLFSQFTEVRIRTVLSHGDLLTSHAG